jgi:hypothetical protein
MVSSVNAKFMAVEKEKKRQRTLAKQQAILDAQVKEEVITPPEVVLETIIEQNPLEILEVITEDVEPKEKQISESKKPKKTYKTKKQSKNNNKILKDS